MKAAATFLLLSSLICLGNADLNGSMPLVASQNEWGLLEEVLGTLLQKEQQLVSELDQLHDDDSDDGEWVMQVKGGLENAIRIANQTKITLKRQVRGLNDYFVFERENPVGSRSKRSVGEFKRHIFEDQAVIWAEHQTQRIRTKRVLKFNDPLWNEQWEMVRIHENNWFL
uniref:Peptidase S8 pro-domain domain-containing protein n=1 Tax=Panagrolaimus sp. JU765 TaxID=591449 RepID=A0AC34RNN8_9BILA